MQHQVYKQMGIVSPLADDLIKDSLIIGLIASKSAQQSGGYTALADTNRAIEGEAELTQDYMGSTHANVRAVIGSRLESRYVEEKRGMRMSDGTSLAEAERAMNEAAANGDWATHSRLQTMIKASGYIGDSAEIDRHAQNVSYQTRDEARSAGAFPRGGNNPLAAKIETDIIDGIAMTPEGIDVAGGLQAEGKDMFSIFKGVGPFVWAGPDRHSKMAAYLQSKGVSPGRAKSLATSAVSAVEASFMAVSAQIYRETPRADAVGRVATALYNQSEAGQAALAVIATAYEK